MFEKAARLKLRFDTSKGLVTVEDLFDLPLTVRNGGASLDNIAKGIARLIRETETESFVLTTTKAEIDPQAQAGDRQARYRREEDRSRRGRAGRE